MQKIITILLITICLSNTHAQESKKISLQEAFDLATQTSKQLQIDSLKIQALDIKKKQTQNTMLPVVGINVGYTRLSGNIAELPPFNFMGKDRTPPVAEIVYHDDSKHEAKEMETVPNASLIRDDFLRLKASAER